MKTATRITIITVADRLDQAAYTMRRLPKVKVQGYASTWPEIVREFVEAYGWNEVTTRLGPPSPRHITEMDETLRWLLWLEKYETKLVWLRANGARWKTIGYRLGFGETKLRSDWKVALVKIVWKLNNDPDNRDFHYKKELKSRAGNSSTECEGFQV